MPEPKSVEHDPATLQRSDRPHNVAADDGVASINTFTWQAWPWVAWILPFFLGLVKGVIAAGWEMVLPLFFTPVVIPLAALISLIPRMLIKDAGRRYVPTHISALFYIHWWSVTLCILSTEGITDGSPLEPPLAQLIFFIPWELADILVSYGFHTAWISYVLMVIFALISRFWAPARLGWVVVTSGILAPVLILGSGFIAYNSSLLGERDIAGDQRRDALQRDAQAAFDSRAQRWDTLQHQLSPVRSQLAEHWYLSYRTVQGAERSSDARQYDVSTTWLAYGAEDPESQATQIEELLHDEGWELQYDATAQIAEHTDMVTNSDWSADDSSPYEYPTFDALWNAPADNAVQADLRLRVTVIPADVSVNDVAPGAKSGIRLILETGWYWNEGHDWYDMMKYRTIPSGGGPLFTVWTVPPTSFSGDQWPRYDVIADRPLLDEEDYAAVQPVVPRNAP